LDDTLVVREDKRLRSMFPFQDPLDEGEGQMDPHRLKFVVGVIWVFTQGCGDGQV
jgi:hypothetical protein